MIDVLQSITAPEFLINLAVKSSLILAIAGIITLLLRNSSAALRHWIWNLAFLAMLLLPVLSFVLPSRELTVLPYSWNGTNHPVAQNETTAPIQKNESGRGFVGLPNESDESMAVATTTSAPFRSHWNLAQLPGLIWIFGGCFLLMKRVAEIAVIYLLCGRKRDRNHTGWNTDLLQIKSKMDIRRSVRLTFSRQVTVPFTVGLIRPFIVLPLAATSWSSGQRRTVLFHELAHIKRFDYVTNLLSEIAKALYWYHPLTWFAARQSQVEREHATDDLVLTNGTENITYADQLLEITRQLQKKSVIARSAVAITNSNSIKKRMEHILARKIARHPLTRKSAFLWLVLLTSFSLAVASVHLQAKEHPVSPAVSLSVAGKSVDDLLEMLDDSRTSVKVAALTGLGKIGDRKSFYRVVKMLREPDSEVRAATLQALYGIGCDPAFVAITVSLRDPDPVVREKAAVFLGRLTNKAMYKPIQRVLSDYGSWAQPYLRSTLGEFEDLPAVDYLIEALVDPVPAVRKAVAKTLEKIDNPRAEQTLSSINHFQNDTDKS